MNYPHGTEDLLKQLIPGHLSKKEEASDDLHMHVITGDKPHLEHIETHVDAHSDKALLTHDPETNTVTVSSSKLKTVAKAVSPYIAVFALALCFYFLFFTNFSLKSIFKTTPKSSTEATVAVSYPNLDAYYTWIQSYYFQVTDPSILEPGNDISGNGLTNYQKFVLGLNPKRFDSLGLGLSDTQNIIEGINPTTGIKYTDEQMKLITQYVDLEAASNKLSLNIANNSIPKIAGANTGSTNYNTNGSYNTGTYNSPTTGVNESNRNGASVNDTINATLDIPSLKLSVPIIWTKDPKSFDADLKNGVVHYPGTALPGEIGNSYISGHSSNYTWAKGSYNQIFAKLGDLKQYDSFSISATDVSGQRVVYHYVITGSQIYKADDQAQFTGNGKSVVALSTCWPIGTSSKRLVVFGELSQVER